MFNKINQRKIFRKLVLTAIVFAIPAIPLMAESLWLKAGSGVQAHYGDHRAAKPGDILTIVMAENVNVVTTQETKADKDSTINDSVTSFLFANAKAGTLHGTMPSTNITGSNQYDGKGNITYQQAMAAKASVLVTDILPNGNLLFEGVRSVMFASEKQYMILHGVVRCDDIAADNTIQSGQIANAYLEIKGEGDLSAAQQKGWLTKLNDFINPF